MITRLCETNFKRGIERLQYLAFQNDFSIDKYIEISHDSTVTIIIFAREVMLLFKKKKTFL